MDENHKPHNMLQTSKRSGSYIPERLCGMDGQWPFSSPEKPKQTAWSNNPG